MIILMMLTKPAKEYMLQVWQERNFNIMCSVPVGCCNNILELRFGPGWGQGWPVSVNYDKNQNVMILLVTVFKPCRLTLWQILCKYESLIIGI